MLQLERAQRAVLKVATFRPYRFPTVDLYSDCEVLTVRKLFVYNIILSQHKKVDVRDNLSTGRRRKDRIIAKPTVKTVFAKRQQTFLGPLLYNKANKAIKGLVNVNQMECKKALTGWLLALNYEETEKLLKVIQ
ncbi:putative RNA-directed DNA polymerase [Operophtera brumata]|uniref:Putative RNA-directed DNA polymerase n=1 Tax=Operophtera brumata TaxID=104452 RepID=A0A0L7LJA6_OPEBR|nr:putative RNA-directed DNA polymerase [Operophtera brumata]KOB78694.1 putative RNA-directed DNA polymerase [Operophtera brumata]